jgi:SHS2 domain-containing protein
MKKHEQIDISGDVGLKVWAESLAELFENAATGLYDLITDTSAINETEYRDIELNADDLDGLLIQWLNELIFLHDTYGFIGKKFKVELESSSLEVDKIIIQPSHSRAVSLKAYISGGLFAPEINESRLLIKAATYHNLSIGKKGTRWEASVIFDI